MGDRYIDRHSDLKYGSSGLGGLASEVADGMPSQEPAADGNLRGGYDELLKIIGDIDPCEPGSVKELVAQFDSLLLENPTGSRLISEYDLSGMLISRAPGAVFDEFLDFHAEQRSAPYAEVKNLLIELDEDNCIGEFVDGTRETTLGAEEVPQSPDADVAGECPRPKGETNLRPDAEPSPKEIEQENIRHNVDLTLGPVGVSSPTSNPAPVQVAAGIPREIQPWRRDPRANPPRRNRNSPAAPKRRAPGPPRAPVSQSRSQVPSGLCNNCWLPGHPTLNCPYPHNSQAERNQVRIQRGYKSNMNCWNCLSNTHLAEDCREGRPGAILPYASGGGRKAIDDARICWNCWEWGHSSSRCTEADRNWVEREELRLKKRGQFTNPFNKTTQSYTNYR